MDNDPLRQRHGHRHLLLLLLSAYAAVVTAGYSCSSLNLIALPGTNLATTQQLESTVNWANGTCYLKSNDGSSPFPPSGHVWGHLLPSCGPCMRLSWTRLSPAAKDTFLSAIELAMDRGLCQKFVWLHAERMNNKEAHDTCLFLFWHRKLLVVFESMLRSLGDCFACLTLPYWDYVDDYGATQYEGATSPDGSTCATIEACSPTTIDWGGSSQGAPSTDAFLAKRFRRFDASRAAPSTTCVPIAIVRAKAASHEATGPTCR
ncbi:Aste57867_7898 [Aphanomyces stellatus]|uniref:Aste57867_7898 protein n=1 Tax=Aphanomyces stellatus TaxID=120398 RepID=A0A485KIX2_9STRA|nr:hypothetical protein As57867_007868 [Aphanomyces stellatus]VFT84791.1 Aste57867_7898 [Aphanomyces stellatus]